MKHHFQRLQRKISLFSQYLIPPFRFPSGNEFIAAVQAPPPQWALAQIGKDLAAHSNGIDSGAIEKLFRTQSKNGKHLFLVRFQIHSGQLRCITDPGFEKEASFFVQLRRRLIARALRWIHKKAPLPDLDFVISLHDSIDEFDLPGPIFALSKRADKDNVILMPDHEALSGNYFLLKQIRSGREKHPWEHKLDIAFWRGLTTGGQITCENFLDNPRGKAVLLSQNHPDLIDARFNGLCQADTPSEILSQYPAFFGGFTGIEDHFRYKYQLLIDGNTCAYSRCFWQLFSNCALLKQDSQNIQWYYHLMQPYEHYLPLKNDLSDLAAQIEWAQKNPGEIEPMIARANQLANNHLSHLQTLYYFYLLLKEYALLQKKSLDFVLVSP